MFPCIERVNVGYCPIVYGLGEKIRKINSAVGLIWNFAVERGDPSFCEGLSFQLQFFVTFSSTFRKLMAAGSNFNNVFYNARWGNPDRNFLLERGNRLLSVPRNYHSEGRAWECLFNHLSLELKILEYGCVFFFFLRVTKVSRRQIVKEDREYWDVREARVLTTCAGNWLRTITSDRTVYNNSSSFSFFWARRYDITG